MRNFDRTWFNNLLEEFAEEGRDVQLFGMFGQTIFPMYSVDGSLSSSAAVFPILRGSGDHAPKFEGSFPTEDGATRDLGNGWIVMCVHFPMRLTPHENIEKLQVAEEKLRRMRNQVGSGG